MERRKICRYFQRGACRKDNCPFVHLKENRKNCVFYMEGYCRKGNNCNFYHPPREQEKLANLKEQLKNKAKLQKLTKKKHESEDSDHQEPQRQQKVQETNHEAQLQAQIEEKKHCQQQQLINASQKTEQLKEQVDHSKINKINFLLGFKEEESDQSSEEEEKTQQPKETIQFTKLYPKKFPDHNKTPEMKQQIKQNQAKFFKEEKFLDLISRLDDPIEKQYYQIIRKYTDSFNPFEGDFFHFTIKMRPLLFEKQMNLHFDFKQDTLDLEIDGRKYPKQRAIISILNPSIPTEYKQKFLSYLSKFHASKSVFDTLKFLQNSFQKLYKESHFKLQNQFYSRKELQKKLKQELNKKQQTSTEQAPKKKKKKEKVPADQNPFVTEIRYGEAEKIDHLSYNYQITVDSMFMNNCEYVLLQKMLVYLECVCQQKIMYIFDGSNDRSLKISLKLKCKKCQNLILFGLERDVVQLRRETLGRIGVSSGHLVDMGGIGFKIGCVCNNQISKGKLLLSGQRMNANCHNCFQSTQISYMGLKFYNPTLKIPQVRVEQELPGKGACKHMKLTFRWYRFGCCGRCFSCDDCHIMGSIVVHEKIKGITMLCGFCSRQQPLGDVCVFCHKQLVKGVEKTGHWEGGFGCRDQATLSRKDNKKYTGMTKKKQKEK